MLELLRIPLAALKTVSAYQGPREVLLKVQPNLWYGVRVWPVR